MPTITNIPTPATAQQITAGDAAAETTAVPTAVAALEIAEPAVAAAEEIPATVPCPIKVAPAAPQTETPPCKTVLPKFCMEFWTPEFWTICIPPFAKALNPSYAFIIIPP